ncbi:hypothetical protein QUC26_12740 [Pseudomonas asiatica]|uniref:hypothetical protein n=1 Tax=Pseudomonas asiatica TaxID=2219225 RepID=UPI0025A080DB|nr:hypothetical protein [Pseudomonas asiatica]WJM55950.1 hypothetical protein QUC26_12740 [Pseudomonas asiatica]
MTIDKQKLKALAEAARDYSGSDLIEHESRYNALACEVDPVTVLTLLAEIERLESAKGDPVGSFDKHMEYMQENIRLKAENEDYRSGQDRYEQIIDDLKAESEALRKALGNLLSLYEEDEGCRSLPQYTAGVAAMTKEASHG